jgi:hypothetical protein
VTAGSVADRELELRAEDLARYVSLDESHKPRLDLSATLQRAYSAAAQQSVFAIRDKDGRLIEASTPEIGALAAGRPPADSEPSYLRLSNFGPSARDYYGVSIRLDSAAGPVSVLVAEASGADQLVHSPNPDRRRRRELPCRARSARRCAADLRPGSPARCVGH